MARHVVILTLCAALLTGCGSKKTDARLDDLQSRNEELTRRVKTLEDDLQEAKKKLIQQDQALEAMRERMRQMEASVNKIELGPSR